MPFPNFQGPHKLWTGEKVITAMVAAAKELLKKPKGTWKTVPADLGDYYQWYGITRHATTLK